jgi:magnesium-transporting ATPase (P-type)
MGSQNIKKNFWHSLEVNEIFKLLNSDIKGLTNEKASSILEKNGLNKLPQGKKISLLNIILHQLLNPLIFILIAAAVASVLIGEGKDAIFIFLVILINSILGTYQEYNAEKSASALQNLLKIKCHVRRDGETIETDSENIVVGDIVYLESGVKIPADLRLVEARNLEIDESFLTGESLSSIKNTKVLNQNIFLQERSNMAYAGATVMSGRGMGIVVATGIRTEVGKIAKNVSSGESAKAPLILRMEKFTKRISIFIIGLSIVLAVILRMQGLDFASIFFFVVALAVSAIPEGLPVALTVALSIATKRMAKRNVIVRKLTSVESLGSCTVIASDKTGTLTVNQQTAKKVVLANKSSFHISGEGYNGDGKIIDESNSQQATYSEHQVLHKIALVGCLANEANLHQVNGKWRHQGDAMDVAFLGMAYKLQLDVLNLKKEELIIDKIPYESELKYAAAFYREKNQVFFGMKGAVETVIEYCKYQIDHEEIHPINALSILEQTEQLASQGYRVLAVANGKCLNYQKKGNYDKDDMPPLTLLGLVCFIDPLRKESKESVETCKKAGIKVIMITGDHPETANAISKELGINSSKGMLVTGNMLKNAGKNTSDAYENLVLNATVFARVSPIQKLEIVEALINNGEFVAVTGDGVNDAPALKRANLGVAMGSGTDVAKEVGNMIVIDDNFSSIVAGVEEGRFAYDNVRKVIFLLISTGAAEVILFMLSIFFGLPLPLLAVQLLWLNLVTNGIQDVALAFEAGEKGAMQKKPRSPREMIFNKTMIRQTLISSFTIGIIVFTFWFVLINHSSLSEASSRNLILLLMVFMQNFHALNSRSEVTSAFKIPIKNNVILIVGIIGAQALHIVSMHLPFMQDILRTEPVSITTWTTVLLLAIPIIIVMEIYKAVKNRLAIKV